MWLAATIFELCDGGARWIAAAAAGSIGLLAAWSAQAGPAGPTEYEVKAAYLFNFAKFIDWPADQSNHSDSPLIIGLLGDDPFGGALEAVLQNKTLRNRKLVLRRLARDEDPKACQILFVSSSEQSRFGAILAAVKDSAVLTVGESDQFLRQGGIISFYLESESVRFAINAARAERAGLKISSKLLGVAKVIKLETSE